MEVNGTEVGLGIGAFMTSILAYFKFKPRKEDAMALLEKRMDRMEGRQNRFEDSLKTLAEATAKDMNLAARSTEEMKDDIKTIMKTMGHLTEGVARLSGIYEGSKK